MAHDADRLQRRSRQSLYQLAIETFGTEIAARAWCERAHPLLEGRSPSECCKRGKALREQALALICAVRYGGAA